MIGISYIVTVYNKRPFLPAVLRAIIDQVGSFDREFVFVDDGSTDDSLTYLRQATAPWPNCRIISQTNRGASGAMNVAVAAATKTYLKLVDADDLLAPVATLRLLEALRSTQAVLAIGGIGRYEPGAPVDWGNDAEQPAREVIEAPLRPMMRHSTINPSALLLARADYLRVGGADEAVCCQDYSLALPLARLGRFVRVKQLVTMVPTNAPGRLSDNKARELHDVTRALGRFLARNPDLRNADKAYAAARACSRARAWARRNGQPLDAIGYRLLTAAARLRLVRDPARTIFGCCRVFDYTPPNKLP